MNKIIIFLSFLLTTSLLSLHAVSLKDAQKAVVRIITYDKQGKQLHSGVAYYVDQQGTAATAFSLLRGAASAEVIDMKGKKYAISRILGANSTTDLIKFTTEGNKTKDYFTITTTDAQKYGKLYLLHYSTNKKEEPAPVNVSSVEDYNNYKYYGITADNDSANIACPLIDEAGNLVAVVQRNVNKDANGACAVDARFINDLQITATSAFNSDLRETFIPKALPTDKQEAMTYLYMMPSIDTAAHITAYNDFIATYPTLPDGYAQRAALYARLGKYADADNDFSKAFEIAKTCTDTTAQKADAIHYNLSDLIYRAAISQADSTPVHQGWTLARAEAEAAEAYALNPATLYLLQQGYCQYAARHYAKAAETFQSVCRDPKFATPETFFSAARSLELSNGDSLLVLSLLDSCIAHIAQPADAQYAQYYLERSQRYINAGRYRDAVFDYNEYEKAIGPKNLNERFYFLREQAELEAKMYQQALDDIRTAIVVSKTPALYQIEEAFLLLRVGEYEEAIVSAEKVLKMVPENPDAYKVLGIAQGETGKTAAAIQNLKKAKELGDDTVDNYLNSLIEHASKSKTATAKGQKKK